MVKESRAKLECRVLEVKSLGESGGAGQLVICEVLRLHIDDSLLDADKNLKNKGTLKVHVTFKKLRELDLRMVGNVAS